MYILVILVVHQPKIVPSTVVCTVCTYCNGQGNLPESLLLKKSKELQEVRRHRIPNEGTSNQMLSLDSESYITLYLAYRQKGDILVHQCLPTYLGTYVLNHCVLNHCNCLRLDK